MTNIEMVLWVLNFDPQVGKAPNTSDEQRQHTHAHIYIIIYIYIEYYKKQWLLRCWYCRKLKSA